MDISRSEHKKKDEYLLVISVYDDKKKNRELLLTSLVPRLSKGEEGDARVQGMTLL